MIKYRVKAIAGQFWKHEQRCLVGISVGKDSHEGEKFRSLCKWIGKRFSNAHIWVADTLHRHNMVFEFCETPDDATTRSRLEGDKWIARNSEALQDLSIPFTMSRWDQWLGDERYGSSKEKIQNLYYTSPELRQAVLADAERYTDSIIRQGRTILDRDFAINRCIDLILEENAVLPLLIEDYGGVDIYPGSELQSTALIRTLPVPGAPEALYEKKLTRVGFKRLKSDVADNQDEISLEDSVFNG